MPRQGHAQALPNRHAQRTAAGRGYAGTSRGHHGDQDRGTRFTADLARLKAVTLRTRKLDVASSKPNRVTNRFTNLNRQGQLLGKQTKASSS